MTALKELCPICHDTGLRTHSLKLSSKATKAQLAEAIMSAICSCQTGEGLLQKTANGQFHLHEEIHEHRCNHNGN